MTVGLTFVNGGPPFLNADNLNTMVGGINDALGVPDAALAGRVVAGATATALNATYAIANPTLTVTYNTDGSVASTVENGVTTTFTYNPDGTVNTQTRAGITRTFTYDGNGNVTGAS